MQAPEVNLVAGILDSAWLQAGLRRRAAHGGGIAGLIGAEHHVTDAATVIASARKPPAVLEIQAGGSLARHQHARQAVGNVDDAPEALVVENSQVEPAWVGRWNMGEVAA